MRMSDFKKDWSLRLAIALPIVMIFFVASSVYLPRLWAPEPQYGFIYSNGGEYNSYGFQQAAVVKKGKLEVRDIPTGSGEEDREFTELRLYMYDVKTGESREVDIEEASMWDIDDQKESPDGFEVKRGGGGGGLFGGYSGEDMYFSGHMTSKKLSLRGLKNSYDFAFLGWIVKK